jgi:hypothetical protein
MVSEREAVQAAIVAHLTERRRYWSAPYGVIAGLQDLPRGGKVRNVTFGVARFLDAHVTVWTPTRIVVEAEGPLASRVEGEFASVEDLIDRLAEVDGSR